MLRVVSDCHGKTKCYRGIVDQAEHSVQIGDLGFKDTYKDLMGDKSFDVSRHKFFKGNHDDYDFASHCVECCSKAPPKDWYKHWDRFLDFDLGDYGMRSHGGVDFYIVRGAFSIDKEQRIEYERIYGRAVRSWWPEEELPEVLHEDIIADFAAARPDVVFTHECPQHVGHGTILKRPEILENFGFNPLYFTTRTAILLMRMWQEHQPKLWIFGHYHVSWGCTVDSTRFICLPELGYIDI